MADRDDEMLLREAPGLLKLPIKGVSCLGSCLAARPVTLTSERELSNATEGASSRRWRFMPSVRFCTGSVHGFCFSNRLLETCAPVQTPTCYTYVEGVIDALQSTFSALRMQQHALFCLPQGVISRQLVDIAINYLRDHPEQRHNVASANVALALANAFPCPK